VEELVFQSQGRGGSSLNRRPVRHSWCAAQSRTSDGAYFFCDWLTRPTCDFFQSKEAGTDGQSAGATRGLTVNAEKEKEFRAEPPARKATVQNQTGSVGTTVTPLEQPKQKATGDSWALPLGAAYALFAKSQQVDSSALGAGSFEIDYGNRELTEQ